MNVEDAAYAVVHDYPGGSNSLAPRLGMTAAVLNSKVNPNTHTHHLSLCEAIRVTELTKDDRIIVAACHATGHVVLKQPTEDDEAPSDIAVLELVAAVGGAQGSLFESIHKALADGDYTELEQVGIRAAAHRAMDKIAALVRRLDALVEG